MASESPTPLDQALASLPPCDVSPAAARRIRRLGRRILEHEATLSPFWRMWTLWLEPALLAASVLVYLGWALQTVVGLLG